MIIYDTNVVSELMRSKPYERVLAFLEVYSPEQTFVTAITGQELWFGATILKDAAQRTATEAKIIATLGSVFPNRILSLDYQASIRAAQLLAVQKARGHELDYADCQIAGIALTKNFSVITRNTKNFDFEALRVINPWLD